MNLKQIPIRRKLEQDIRAAFSGVILGNGVSLSQAEVIDRYGKDRDSKPISDKQFRDLKSKDEVTHWTRITLDDLDRDNIAHLDAEGLRYYLPALMLSVLEAYDPGSMRVIGTLSALDPRPMSKYHIVRYSLLDDRQKRVIAQFLSLLPALLQLDRKDEVRLERAVTGYWQRFLPNA